MTSFQRVIKYIALAFGIFLAIQIISWIVFGIGIFLGITTGFEPTADTQEFVEYKEEILNAKNIKIFTSVSKITIKTGEEFKVEANNVTENFTVNHDNDTLTIRDENVSDKWLNKQEKIAEIILYIPEDTIFENVVIEAGIGDMQIEEILAEKLTINMGAGNTNIEKLYAKEAKIEGGAGKGSIKNAIIHNLDLDTGVGKFELEGTLTGKNEIDCGVGKLELTLIGNKEDYTIMTDNGIGAIYVDGRKMENNATYGSGENIIDIDNGIGTVEVKFK